MAVNHVNVLVKGNRMYAWINGVFLGNSLDPLHFSKYGGIAFRSSWEAMASFDDVIVRSVGLNPNLPDADFDYDEDGFTNLEEYQNGTNPLVSDTPQMTKLIPIYFLLRHKKTSNAYSIPHDPIDTIEPYKEGTD